VTVPSCASGRPQALAQTLLAIVMGIGETAVRTLMTVRCRQLVSKLLSSMSAPQMLVHVYGVHNPCFYAVLRIPLAFHGNNPPY